jgi:hypothetical protein
MADVEIRLLLPELEHRTPMRALFEIRNVNLSRPLVSIGSLPSVDDGVSSAPQWTAYIAV